MPVSYIPHVQFKPEKYPYKSSPQQIADQDILTSPEKNKSSYIQCIHPD